ncbi:MAG: hypothetical protein AAF411_11835 [Myxococcota bacterium]
MRYLPIALIVACGGAPAGPVNHSVEVIEIPDAQRVTPPDVTLLGAGQSPRVALRLHPEVGESTAFTVRMSMRMALSFGGQDAPPADSPDMVMVIGTRIRDIDASGTFRRDLVIEEVSVDPSHPLAAQIAPMLEPMRGMEGFEVFDAQGRPLAAHLNIPANVPEQMRDTLERSIEMMQGSSPPFPEEEVGVGARWRSVSRQYNRFQFTRTTEYELLARDGDTITLRANSTLAAEPQPFELDDQHEAQITAYEGGGTANVNFELNSARMSSEGTADVTLSLELEPSPDNPNLTQMSISTRMGAVIESVERERQP